MMAGKRTLRRAIGGAVFFASMLMALPPAQGASAVAVALDPRTGKALYGYWTGGLSENEVKERAMRVCTALGGTKATILASTSRRGFGAIISFEGADKRSRFAASLAGKTEQAAIQDALQKAKAAGGRYAKVLKTWNDSPSQTQPKTIKL